MRVIAGVAKGHALKCPEGLDVRPTADKIKGAIFSMVMPYLYDADVLDLFAGTGALGIEALSRSAKHADFVEISSANASFLKENLEHTKLINSSSVFITDAINFIQSTEKTYDIILLDPPYFKDLIPSVLDVIKKRRLLNKEGVIITEWDETAPPAFVEGFEVVRQKRYGRTYISILKEVY